MAWRYCGKCKCELYPTVPTYRMIFDRNGSTMVYFLCEECYDKLSERIEYDLLGEVDGDSI